MLSVNSQKKAEYKQKLWDWLVALIIVFFIHYIMSFILVFTDELTNIFTDANGDTNSIIVSYQPGLDLTLNPLSWVSGLLNATGVSDAHFKTNIIGLARFNINNDDVFKKIAYIIFYGALIFQTFKFLKIYLTRVVTMAFLTVISPLVALTYPLDKLGDGQAQAFNMWWKEYLFNALIQPFHLLIYKIFAGTAAVIMLKGEGGQDIVYMFFMITIFRYMPKAEELLKKMFGFGRAPMGTTEALSMSNVVKAGALGAVSNSLVNAAKTHVLPKLKFGFPGKSSSSSSSGSQSSGSGILKNIASNKGTKALAQSANGLPNSQTQQGGQQNTLGMDDLDDEGQAWYDYATDPDNMADTSNSLQNQSNINQSTQSNGQNTTQPTQSSGQNTSQPTPSSRQNTSQSTQSNGQNTSQSTQSNGQNTSQSTQSSGQNTTQPTQSSGQNTTQPISSNGQNANPPALPNINPPTPTPTRNARANAGYYSGRRGLLGGIGNVFGTANNKAKTYIGKRSERRKKLKDIDPNYFKKQRRRRILKGYTGMLGATAAGMVAAASGQGAGTIAAAMTGGAWGGGKVSDTIHNSWVGEAFRKGVDGGLSETQERLRKEKEIAKQQKQWEQLDYAEKKIKSEDFRNEFISEYGNETNNYLERAKNLMANQGIEDIDDLKKIMKLQDQEHISDSKAAFVLDVAKKTSRSSMSDSVIRERYKNDWSNNIQRENIETDPRQPARYVTKDQADREAEDVLRLVDIMHNLKNTY